ncbi:hypothetical protein LVY74_01550 [Acinetobacter sp. ME22]|uniref:hypothetical protein n=1 Tax=Acinetobacter sp. ME22 TaxID=2904802 RepID=UPI001EDC307D|nr:hypothetical protein [Acinetobacter sp. ME22]MCG2572241.1 hypothetical protein [Acinetobacter sp. ME22]
MYGLKRSKKDESGMIQGAGTGTSDSIQKDVPVGSYIMPADSTQKIGAKNLKNLGSPQSVRVNVSDGEYLADPQQLQAIGGFVLDRMKQATHTPVDQQGFGLKQGTGYASRQGNDLQLGLNPEALANYQNSSNVKIGKSGKPELFFANGTPASGVPDDSFTADVLRTNRDAAANSISKGNYAQGVGQMVRGVVGAVPAAAYDVSKKAYDTVGRPVANAIDGFLGTGGDQSAPSPKPNAQPKPKVPTTNNNTGVTDNPFGDKSAQQAAAKQAAAKTPVNNIFNLGQDQPQNQQSTQSNPYAIQQKGNSFSYSNPAAAAQAHAAGIPELQNSGFGMRRTSDPRGVANLLANTREMGPNDQQIQNAIAQREASVGNGGGFGARVYSLGNSSQAADTLQKRIDDVSQPIPGSKGLTASQRNQIVELQNGFDNRANDVYKTDANNAAALQREAMGQAGANYRADLQEGGQNNRYFAGLAQDTQKFNATNDLANRQFGLEQSRYTPEIMKQRAELNALQRYDQAKTPEERQAAEAALATLRGQVKQSSESGKDRYITVGGGQQWDDKAQGTLTQPQRLFDTKTQKFVDTTVQIPIHQNPAAQAIVNNKSLDEASKRKALADLGYQNN